MSRRNHLDDILRAVGAFPGETAENIAPRAGMSTGGLRNVLYSERLYFTLAYYGGRSHWFLTERGREYVRALGGTLQNDKRTRRR